MTAWTRRRIGVAVLSAILATGALTTSWPATGQAETTTTAFSWSVPLAQAANPNLITVTPTGNMVAPGCTDVTSSGQITWNLAPGNGWGCPSAIGDSQGNTYVSGYDHTSRQWFVEALDPTGTVLWRKPLAGNGTGAVLGANGNVYFEGAGHVEGFNEQTGAVTELNTSYLPYTAYSNGLALAYLYGVEYLSYDGSVLAKYNGSPLSGGNAIAAGGNGDIFIAGYDGFGSNSHLLVEKFTPAGLAWTYSAPVSPSVYVSLAATPDGGVIEDSGGNPGAAVFRSIGPTGSLRWTFSPQGPFGPSFYTRGLAVDRNGVVALPSYHSITCAGGRTNNCADFHIDFLSQDSKSPALSAFDWVGTTPQSLVGVNALSIDNGRIYVVNDTNPSAKWILYAFPESGLATGYPLSVQEALTNATPSVVVTPTQGFPGTQFSVSWQCPVGAAASLEIMSAAGSPVLQPLPVSANGTDYVAGFQSALAPGTYGATASCAGNPLPTGTVNVVGASYVALGDSFASGEGAPAFLAGTDQGGHGCHRATDGYAEQIAKKRGGTFDFAACSGAVIPDVYNPNSENPDEIAQILHLSKTTTNLVTFSMGGNDVGFVDVLNDCISVSNLLGLFSHTGGHGCASRDASRMQTALNWLKNGRASGCYPLPGTQPDTGIPETVCGAQDSLGTVYEKLAAQVTPGARILVTGYPQFWGNNFHRDPRDLSAGPVCGIFSRFGFNATVSKPDADWMNGVALQLNNIIGNAVRKAAALTHKDIEFVGVDTSFQTHRHCDSGSPYFNNLIPSGTSIDQRSLHPNQNGQNAYYSILAPHV